LPVVDLAVRDQARCPIDPSHFSHHALPMTFDKLLDALWFLPNAEIAWPSNDRPDEFRLARLLNLLYVTNGATVCFWGQSDEKSAQGMVLFYVRVDGREVECHYSMLNEGAILESLTSGLQAWDEAQSVRFNEEITSFFGVGPAASRAFLPPARREHLEGQCAEAFMLLGDLSPYAERYTASREIFRNSGHLAAPNSE
jgi:hypothetical protein